MTYVLAQVAVSNASTVPLFTVPPGLCNVTFWQLGAGTVFIGTSTAVTTSNGMQCHSIPTSFSSYVSSKSVTFYGANTSGLPGTVQYIMVTGQLCQ